MIRKTLTALALTAMVAQPAQANDDFAKILFGVILGAAIVDASKSHAHTVHVIDGAANHNRVVQSQTQAQRQIDRIQRETVCRIQERVHHNGMIIREEFNCAGEMIRFYFP